MNDDFEVVGDEAREARVVAVILGEASDFEKEEVARLCEENPELAVFRRRVEAVHGLIGESRVQNPESRPSTWKLSKERRAEVLEKLGEKETVVEGPKKRRALSSMKLSVWTVAACVAVLVMLAGVLVPIAGTAGRSGLAIHKSASEEMTLESEVRELSSLAAQGQLEVKDVSPSIARKPSAPSSEMAQVIAANSKSLSSIPVPSVTAPVESVDFGDGDDYGAGWGEGIAKNFESLPQITAGLRSGDFAFEGESIDGILSKQSAAQNGRSVLDFVDVATEPKPGDGGDGERRSSLVLQDGRRVLRREVPAPKGIITDEAEGKRNQGEHLPKMVAEADGSRDYRWGLQLSESGSVDESVLGEKTGLEPPVEEARYAIDSNFSTPPRTNAARRPSLDDVPVTGWLFKDKGNGSFGMDASPAPKAKVVADSPQSEGEFGEGLAVAGMVQEQVEQQWESKAQDDPFAADEGGGERAESLVASGAFSNFNGAMEALEKLEANHPNNVDAFAAPSDEEIEAYDRRIEETRERLSSMRGVPGGVAGGAEEKPQFFGMKGRTSQRGEDAAEERSDSVNGGLERDLSASFLVTPATPVEFFSEYEPPELPNHVAPAGEGLGASEELGRLSLQKRESVEQALRVAELEQSLKKKEQLLARAKDSSGNGKEDDDLVELATEMHDYNEAAREYESSLALLQELKLKHSTERVALRSPKEPITIAENPKVSPKRSGLLGLGDYESKAVVQVNTPGLGFGSNLGVLESREYFSTQEEVVKAGKTLEMAVESEGLAKKWGVSREKAIERLKKNVKVRQRTGTDLMEIVGKSEDPKEAAEIARAVGEAYQTRRSQEEAKRMSSQLKALNDEVEDQKDKVESKRKVLDAIVRITGRPYFEGTRNSPESMETRMTMMAEKNAFEMKRDRDQYKIYLDKLETLDSEQLLRYAAELPVDNNSVRSLHAEYLAACREYEATKAAGLGVSHPQMKMVKVRVQALRKELDGGLVLLKDSLETNFDLISERLVALDGGAISKELKQEIAAQKAELARLKREAFEGGLTGGERRPAGITNKLQNIIIPEVDFEDVSLEEAMLYLTQQTMALDSEPDPDRKGINFVIEKGAVESGFLNEEDLGGGDLLLGDASSDKTIDVLRLRNVPLATALEYIANKTGNRYRIDEDVVTFLPLSQGGSADLVTRTWKISAEAYAQLMAEQEQAEDPFASEGGLSEEELTSERDALENSGVDFPDGASVRYLPDSGALIVRNTVSNLDIADRILESLQEQAQVAQETLAMNEKDAATQADSTFSLHVSDVSFKLAQAALKKGQWPETVRVEEFVNAFSYGEQVLKPEEKVGMAMEQVAHPFLSQRNLLRMSLQTAATGRGAGVPLRLTVVLDKSGSMERVDRAAAVDEAFRVLVEQLHPGDKVTLVGFSRTPSLLADFVDGSEGPRLLKILRETPSEGGTNVEEALGLALTKSLEHYEKGAQNRVILLTDGIANLGASVPEYLMKLVEGMREKGVAFDACGVGVEGLNDEILEALTRKGDGRYYILGSQEESGADFAKQVAGALRPAAQNVKVQIEWNPNRVGKWRLYGFEKHELKKEDFRNDSVDAAEMAAEEEGVALYHVEVKPGGKGPLGVARVRFLDVASNEMVEREWEITYEGEAARMESADPKVRLAAVAGLTAEKLARSAVGERVEWDDLLRQVRLLKAFFPREDRVKDLEEMIELAKGLE